MSLERKEIEHRILRARQRTGPASDEGSAPTNINGLEPSAPALSSSSVSSASTTSSTTIEQTTSTPEPSSTTTSSILSTSSSTPSTTSTSTISSSSSSSSISTSSSSTTTSSSSSSSSSSSTTTSSAISTTSSVPSSTSTSTFFVTADPETSSFSSIRRVSTSASVAGGSTAIASDTNTTQSGAINTGAMVGGIAGGLLALAVLGFIVACLLRRKNRRRREARFNAAQFRKSAMIVNDEEFIPVPRPSEMIQNRMNVVPSTGSIVGAGMAGAGAYKFQNQNAQDFEEPYHDNTPMTAEHGYSAQPVGSAAYQHQPLQPKQQYTFGQTYEPSVGDAYGSEHHGSDYHGADIYDPAMFTNYPKQHQSSEAPNRHSVATVADDAYGGI